MVNFFSRVVCALSVVQAVRVTGILETCDTNMLRINEAQLGSHLELYEKSQNGEFKDQTFPAARSSLFWKSYSTDNFELEMKYTIGVALWSRPGKFYMVDQPSLWGNMSYAPMSAVRGAVNDQWFLASAAALAEIPQRVKNLFRNQEYTSSGFFEVIFYVNGKQTLISVDDRIPFGFNELPLNSRPSDSKGWWMVILEKAYAKLNVNFENLDGGTPQEALRALTGMPVLTYKTSSLSEKSMQNTIQNSTQNGYIMTAVSDQNQFGLEGDFVYTILSFKEIKKDNKTLFQFVKMRHPIEARSYSGPWHNSDDRWTDDFKSQVGFEGPASRTFYVPLSDFKSLFSEMQVTFFRDVW